MPKGKGTYGSQVGRPPKKQKYQDGGLLKGASHAEGGIPAIVNGKVPVELEGNEYITRASSVTPETEPLLEYGNETGELPPIFNAKERSQVFRDEDVV